MHFYELSADAVKCRAGKVAQALAAVRASGVPAKGGVRHKLKPKVSVDEDVAGRHIDIITLPPLVAGEANG